MNPAHQLLSNEKLTPRESSEDEKTEEKKNFKKIENFMIFKRFCL